MIKGVRQVLQLVDEVDVTVERAATVVGKEAEQLKAAKPALEALVLSELVEVLLSCFELELYDNDEHGQIWWMSDRLLLRCVELYGAVGTTNHWLQFQRRNASVLQSFCRACTIMSWLYPPKQIKFMSPFLEDVEPSIRDRQRFEQRFGWLGSLTDTNARSFTDYDEWRTSFEALNNGKTGEEARCEARELFQGVSEMLTQSSSQGLIDFSTGSQYSESVDLISVQRSRSEWFSALSQVCEINLATLDESTSSKPTTFRFAVHPWFPTWQPSQ